MQKLPNIVLIMSDQQRWDSIGANGNCFVHTPNLDAMANNGASFEHAYTPYPVCTPARATLWTGLAPSTHGITYNRYGIDDVFNYEGKVKTTIFEALQEFGYTTAYFGKWHLGEKNSGRFDIWEGFNSRGGHWEEGRQAFQEGKYKPETQTDKMIAFLESNVAQETPFFAVQSYYPPHNPFTAPTEFYEHYRGKGIVNPGYYAAVTALDSYVGRIRQSLIDSDQLENTILIYLSDHGETFDETPNFPHKFSCKEDSIRVPMILEGGCVPCGVKPTQFVGLEDIVPTIYDLIGTKCPADLEGQSLLPLLKERSVEGRAFYYVQTEANKTRTIQRCVRTHSHKLILSADEAHELYDLRIDPEEKLNIFGAPKADIHLQYTHCEDQSPVVATLAQMMCDRATQIKDWAGVELAERILRQNRMASA